MQNAQRLLPKAIKHGQRHLDLFVRTKTLPDSQEPLLEVHALLKAIMEFGRIERNTNENYDWNYLRYDRWSFRASGRLWR